MLDVAWQEHFPNVQVLSMDMYICSMGKSGGCGECGLRPADKIALHDWLQTTKIDLKGGRVRVKVRNHYGRFGGWDRCKCVERIERLLERMAMREE